MRFTPTESFYSDEMQCHYLKGFYYSITAGSEDADEAISRIVSVWVNQGKVKLVDANGTGGHFSMQGQGSIH